MTTRSRRTRTIAAQAAVLAWVALPARAALAQAKVTCIAAADRGQELRDEGKYRAAREAFVACARDVCPALVAKSCMRWLADLDAALPTVVFAARDAEGRDVAAAAVRVDGEVVAGKIDGMPLPIDPGEHVVRVEREGSPPTEVRVVVRAGEKGRSIAVTLASIAAPVPERRAPAPPPAPAPVATLPAPSAESTRPASPRAFFLTRSVTTLTLLGAAAVSTAGAVYFGAQARGEAGTAAGYRAQNPSNACVRATSSMCTAWSDAVDAQNRDAVLDYALFTAAGVFAVGAAATWLLWPRASAAPSIAVSLSPGQTGLRIGGSF